jgi:uncharacterized protein YbaA (DUF1428 family)
MRYVDGFLSGVSANGPKSRKSGARTALEYRECVGDDLNVNGMVSFPRTIKLKRSETVVFA